MLQQIEDNIPMKYGKSKKKGKSLPRETIRKMKLRKNAWNKYRKFPSERTFEVYKKIRNAVNGLIRRDDTNRKKIIQGFKGKPKAFYGYTRDLQTVKENVMPLVKEDGELTGNDQETAELLASYFQEVFTIEDRTNVPTMQECNLNWDNSSVDFKPEDMLK